MEVAPHSLNVRKRRLTGQLDSFQVAKCEGGQARELTMSIPNRNPLYVVDN